MSSNYPKSLAYYIQRFPDAVYASANGLVQVHKNGNHELVVSLRDLDSKFPELANGEVKAEPKAVVEVPEVKADEVQVETKPEPVEDGVAEEVQTETKPEPEVKEEAKPAKTTRRTKAEKAAEAAEAAEKTEGEQAQSEDVKEAVEAADTEQTGE